MEAGASHPRVLLSVVELKKNMDVLTEGECVAFVMILSTLCSEGSVRNVCVASSRPNQIFFFFFLKDPLKAVHSKIQAH